MYYNLMNLPADASEDQSNCPPDYYRRSNGMLHQLGLDESPPPPEHADLSRLDSMGLEELKTLVRRVCAARWGEIALMSEDEAYEAVCLKMLHGGLTQSDVWKALPPLREWADRRRGKAPQSIAMTVESKGIDKLSDERLLRLESQVARMTGEDAIVIPAEPKKLDMVGD